MSGNPEGPPLTIKALRACRAWHWCERHGIGTYQAKMELCAYSEWLTLKALETDGAPEEYAGPPQLFLMPVELVRCNEEAAWDLVLQAEAEMLSSARGEKEVGR